MKDPNDFTATTLIKGVCNSPTESFDPSKHSVIFQFNQGDTLHKEIPNLYIGGDQPIQRQRDVERAANSHI
jgi:hypothetical protein